MGSGKEFETRLSIAEMEVMLQIDELGSTPVCMDAAKDMQRNQPDVFKDLVEFSRIVYPDDQMTRQKFLDSKVLEYAIFRMANIFTNSGSGI